MKNVVYSHVFLDFKESFSSCTFIIGNDVFIFLYDINENEYGDKMNLIPIG